LIHAIAPVFFGAGVHVVVVIVAVVRRYIAIAIGVLPAMGRLRVSVVAVDRLEMTIAVTVACPSAKLSVLIIAILSGGHAVTV
jgi:hypothetical protein